MSAPNSDYDPKQVAALGEDEVAQARDAALAAIEAADSLDALKAVRIAHTGDRSPLALANREIGALPPQARKDAGKRIGQARGAVNQALAARGAALEALEEERRLVEETVDVTLPTDREPVGARHPITTIQEHVADLFVAMGWEVAEGPEVEAEWLNFDALNLGPNHPARTMQDTFWVSPERAALVLRTHTSPVQARSMLTRTPPIYVVCPGRVYRTDEADATHMPVFHQVEGLAIDRGLSMAHLKGTLDHFAAAEVVVAPHGAGLVNLTFAPPGVRVLELFAPRYLNPGYWAIVDNVPDSRYRYVVAEPVDRLRSERAMQGVQDDVDLPADVVLEELEHLLAQDADGQEAPGRTDAGQDGTEHPRSPERGTP